MGLNGSCKNNKVRKFIVQSQLLFNKLDKGGVEIVPLSFNLNISKPVSYENETLSL
jgi:hypothetical protein